MNLDIAIETLTAEFPLAQDDAAVPDSILEITSGGIRAERDIEPLLCASQSLAIRLWLREATETLREHQPAAIRFIGGAHLDKWLITVTDAKSTQRTAEHRWSVTAKIGLFMAAKQAAA